MIQLQKNEFYVLHKSDYTLIVNENLKKALPILWNSNGEYCIIPKSVVQNAIDAVTIQEKITPKNTIPQIRIYWLQGIQIDNMIGRILSGE